jgi:NADH-quinone oxidoreductase subunit F
MHALPRRHGLAVSHGASHRKWLKGRPEDLDMLDTVAGNIMGRTICALGDAAAMPVRGMLKHYRDEFEYHIEHKHCSWSSRLPVNRPRVCARIPNQ